MECIAVGSSVTDECAAVVHRYAQRDNRIKLVTAEEGAASDVRNTGIEQAAGRYLLFLDAADRLCEDAWEQIEAAVGEEYADFVAFSRITSLRNGKLKAQMLPISDVISTDEREVRRLMYADSVLDACGGKLFKSRIIRDNHIFFQTDLTGTDFRFVSEYFEHSESCLLTKAMILYSPPERKNALEQYNIEERVDRIRMLYDFSVSAVSRYNDSALTEGVKMYFLEMLSDLFGEYIKERCYRRDVVDTLYEKALGTGFLKRFLNEVDGQEIHSGLRRYEYRLLRQGDAARIRRYFAVRTGSVAKIQRYFR